MTASPLGEGTSLSENWEKKVKGPKLGSLVEKGSDKYIPLQR